MNTSTANTDTVAIRIAHSFDSAWDKSAERGARAYAWCAEDLSKDKSKIKRTALATALVGIGAVLGATLS